MNFFDIQYIAFRVLDYDLSWLELTGVSFGLLAVWLTGREKAAGWLVGLVNIVLAAILYYQIRLYSDFFLQGYYFATNLYGWYFWTKNRRKTGLEPEKRVPVSNLTQKQWLWVILIALTGTIVIGNIINRLHLFLPALFPEPAAYPFADTVVLTVSLIAQYLMTRKILECWLLWIGVDLLAAYLYFQKDVLFLSLEYLIFTALAYAGWRKWKAIDN